MIIYLLILLLLILSAKYIYDLHNFNHSASIIQLQNPNSVTIKELMNERSPLIIHNLSSKYPELMKITIDALIESNPGYIINDNNKNISLYSFGDKKITDMFVYENANMIKDFRLDSDLNAIIHSFMDNLSCNINNTLSILKGNHSIALSQNKHNIKIFTQLSGKTTFYIFNPKHKNDIIKKTNDQIKKWSFKIELKPGIILYIPTEWYYIFETEDESVLCSSYCDNYLTWIYNSLR